MLIFHPSVAPFVQQAARALHEAGVLDRFHTTIRPDERSRLQRISCAGARLAGLDLRGRLARRAVTEVPPGRVATSPWREWLRLGVGALDRSGRATDLIWEWAEIAFDREVAASLRPEFGGVYGFEHSSRQTFETAHELGLGVVYDVPAPETQLVRRLLAAEIARFPELDTDYQRHIAPREQRRLERRRAEWQAADLVIANSEFTRRTYQEAGLGAGKIRVVPYGAPPVVAPEALLDSRRSGPLQLLWAGTFGVRKGAHYLIEAWRAHQFGRHARLLIHGTVSLPRRILEPLPAGVEIGGAVSRDRLMEAYRRSDVLMFPTLCDGFGLVVTEAFSQGLPVITTTNAGAADLVRPGSNGLLVEAANAEAIARAISWCLDHPGELWAMRDAALCTAASWQWADYRRALVAALRQANIIPATK